MAASHNGHLDVARLLCEAGAEKDKAIQDVVLVRYMVIGIGSVEPTDGCVSFSRYGTFGSRQVKAREPLRSPERRCEVWPVSVLSFWDSEALAQAES